MRFLTKKRVKSHVLETIIGSLMVIFAAIAIYIMVEALQENTASPEAAIIEILIVIILAILAQTVILIKIFEQNLNK